MQVEFRKTGERRYAVVVKRKDLPDLQMNPAPGFDPLMPHDLLHFLVEREFGLRRGIFGQVAEGGTAGTFHQAASEKHDARSAARLRRKTAQRGKKLLHENLDDCARSERATYVCLYDWLAHSADERLRERAAEMKTGVESALGQMPPGERALYDEKRLAAMRAAMDELSARWSQLEINQSLTLEWTL